MKLKKTIYFICFLGMFLSLAHFGKVFHRQFPVGDWRVELNADNAGYYVYLPAVFIYNFDISKIPENYVKNNGQGFWADSSGRLFTKYTYGVALAEMPFFLINHLNQKIRGGSTDGFSQTYNRCLNDASAFYACIGIFSVILFLKKYYGLKSGAIATLSLYFGTCLYYYTVKAPGASHVFNFGLFGLYLLISQKLIEEFSRGKLILLFILLAFMILIRPTNALFAFTLFFIEIDNPQDFKARLKLIITPKHIALFTLILFIFLLPQFIYWHYISGKYIYYSYEGATFTNLHNPKFIQVMFSASNGLFLYGPVNILIFSSALLYFNDSGWQNKMSLILMMIMIYLTASWFSWDFGSCSFGERNVSEWSIVLLMPWSAFIKNHLQNKDIVKFYSLTLILVFVLWNIALTENFPFCWFGKSYWDFDYYFNLFK